MRGGRTLLLGGLAMALALPGCSDAEGRSVVERFLPRATGSPELTEAVRTRIDSLGDPTLDSVYPSRAVPLWVAETGLRDAGVKLLAELEESEGEGLDPARYDVPRLLELQSAAATDSATNEEGLAELETGLTAGAALLARDLAAGQLPATSFDPGWDVDSLDQADLPSDVSEGGAILDHLDRVRPANHQYRRLRSLLARLEERSATGGWDSVPLGERIVEAGDTGRAVAALRRRLEQSLSQEERRLALRNAQRPRVFDSALVRGLTRFQSRHGLERDGVLGPETAAALNASPALRAEEVEIALERWRWLPATLGTPAVLVNTAGRRVHVFEGGEAEISMKVIIGQRDWRTALFQDVMERVVVNPYWNVPQNIMEEETIPKARKDPSYLRDNDFEVVDRESWETIPLSSIDWNEVDPETFPHLIRQKPGEKNALGFVKFRFPNRYAIYLHDTPADHLFDERLRTFSHGCIRVERPVELAHYVFREATDHPPSRFDELRATGERHVVELDRPIPTYVVYQTVWVDDQGVPTFTPDVYDRNEDVRRAFRRVDDRPTDITEETP